MMQKEKLLKRSLLIAVAAASLTVTPAVVKAEDNGNGQGQGDTFTGTLSDAGLDSVSVDASTSTLTAKIKGTASEVLVGTGKTKKNGTMTVSAWDVYDLEGKTEIEVDLSKLKNTVDNYLTIQTNAVKDNQFSIIKIPVAYKYVKAKYNAATDALQLGYGDNSSQAALADIDFTKTEDQDKAKKFEFRTTYSGWDGLVKVTGNDVKPVLDTARYQENGTQLYLRLKAGEAGAVTEDPDETYTYNNESAKRKVFVAPSLPGKEVKVTIAAKSKGPSISANFTNGTVKIPKGAEYRFIKSGGTIYPGEKQSQTVGNNVYEYLVSADATEKDVNTILAFEQQGENSSATILGEAVLEVRKAATTKKAASKWSRLRLVKLEGLSGVTAVGKKDDKSNMTAGNTYGGEGIAKAEVKEGDSNVLVIKYTSSSKKADAVQDSFEVYNQGAFDYEIFVDENSDFSEANPPKGKLKKVTKVAKGKPSKAVKFSKKADGLTVWVRKAGDKKISSWASQWVRLGEIDYLVVVPTPTPTPAISPAS